MSLSHCGNEIHFIRRWALQLYDNTIGGNEHLIFVVIGVSRNILIKIIAGFDDDIGIDDDDDNGNGNDDYRFG